jgi:hypothetical protein
MSSGYCIIESNILNWPKGIAKHQNDPKEMHYPNEGIRVM